MTGLGSTRTATKRGNATQSRIHRADQLKQQRVKVASSSSAVVAASDGDEVLVVSGICTVICGFLIVCLGAAMATIFFMVYQPECLKGASFGIADAASFASPKVPRQSSAASETIGLRLRQERTPETTAAAVAEIVWMPPQCTPSQMTRLAQQLPPGGCETFKDSPWRRTSCSFSLAASCHDPIWFRQHYAQAQESDTTFNSILVGCNKGFSAIDMLAIGSKDPDKYDWKKWRSTYLENPPENVVDNSDSCPQTDVLFQGSKSKSKAQAYCIEPVPKTFQRLQETKDKLGIGDELQLTQMAISNIRNDILISNTEPLGVEGTGFRNWEGACANDNSNCTKVHVDTLDQWISNTPSIGPNDPIHYISFGLEGYDYLALVGSARSLHRVHYLHLHYHWIGDWKFQHLADMLLRLQRRHFVCYFTGTDNLWRITDCWQVHYDHRFYSNIACVNTKLAEPLAKEMERIFEQTLEKDLEFGDK